MLIFAAIAFYLVVIPNQKIKMEPKEIDRYLWVSDENLKKSGISTNQKTSYTVEFKLENRLGYTVELKGSCQIQIESDKNPGTFIKVNDNFTYKIDGYQTVIVKVYLSSYTDSTNGQVDYINIFEATYKKK